MDARNSAELKKMLLKEARKAMTVVSKKAMADMQEETAGFYAGTTPKQYERTGALMDTPSTTPISAKGDELEFSAYLDDTGSYTTGKNPTMHDVLELADRDNRSSSVGYLAPVVGNGGFWERSEAKIEKDFNETFTKFFEK